MIINKFVGIFTYVKINSDAINPSNESHPRNLQHAIVYWIFAMARKK